MAEHQHSDKHEAHRKLVGRLREMTSDVKRITAGLDEASLAKRTVADKWSLKELLCHLERMQEVFDGRIEAMLSRDNPAVAKYEPDDDPEFDKMLDETGRRHAGGIPGAPRAVHRSPGEAVAGRMAP